MQLHDLSFLRFDAAGENTVDDHSALYRKVVVSFEMSEIKKPVVFAITTLQPRKIP